MRINKRHQYNRCTCFVGVYSMALSAWNFEYALQKLVKSYLFALCKVQQR